MSRLAFFVATCPACKKKNQLELIKLGKTVACLGCTNFFQAQGSDSTSASLDDPMHYWGQFTVTDTIDPAWTGGDSKYLGRTPR